jgi:hypothetical protein
MPKDDFVKQVLASASPGLKNYQEILKLLANRHVHEHARNPQHGHTLQCVSECHQLIAHLVERFPAEQEHEIIPASSAPHDVGLQLLRDRFLAAYTPIVEQLRQTLFGSPTPPFATYLEAVEWLEMADKAQQRPSEADWEKGHQLRQEVHEKIREWQQHIRLRIHLDDASDAYTRGVPYVKFSGSGDEVQVWHWITVFTDPNHPCCDGVANIGTDHAQAIPPLARLEVVAHEMAKNTGFAKWATVQYILTGHPPTLPLAKLAVRPYVTILPTTERSGSAFPTVAFYHHTYANLTLYTPHVTEGNIREILRSLRAQWRAKRTKRLSLQHQILIDIVEDLGGEPEKGATGTVAFWKTVQKRAGICGINWRATRRMYRDAKKKLNFPG